MRNLIKTIIEKVPSSFLERALALSILAEKFSGVREVPKFQNREALWADLFEHFEENSVTVLEFGVWRGVSINNFAKLNRNSDSQFVGFDSFLGLPENWRKQQPKGTFSVQGVVPEVADNRIRFVEGYFQNTLRNFIKTSNLDRDLIVHFDADLYSATLFVLMELDRLKISYYAVFDEFTGHENRALYRYLQISGASIDFIARTGVKMYPQQVSCKINPTAQYQLAEM